MKCYEIGLLFDKKSGHDEAKQKLAQCLAQCLQAADGEANVAIYNVDRQTVQRNPLLPFDYDQKYLIHSKEHVVYCKGLHVNAHITAHDLVEKFGQFQVNGVLALKQFVVNRKETKPVVTNEGDVSKMETKWKRLHVVRTFLISKFVCVQSGCNEG